MIILTLEEFCILTQENKLCQHCTSKITPILKDKIWGGNKLNKLLGKPTDSGSAGESWELSDVEGILQLLQTEH